MEAHYTQQNTVLPQSQRCALTYRKDYHMTLLQRSSLWGYTEGASRQKQYIEKFYNGYSVYNQEHGLEVLALKWAHLF